MLDLYPRGFIGAEHGPSTEKRPRTTHEIRQSQNTFQIITRENTQNKPANTNVEALFAAVVRAEPGIRKLEFRKKVLLAALSAFGTDDFKFWLALQRKSPSFGDYHSDFLDDTLRFIATGRRRVHLVSWNELVTAQDVGDSKTELSEYAEQFFKDFKETALIDVIQQWLAQPDGMEDMLFTLHILFGNK